MSSRTRRHCGRWVMIAGPVAVAAVVALPTGTAQAASGSAHYDYTGAVETWTVPAGVGSVHVKVCGASGQYADDIPIVFFEPGKGGCVTADLVVSAGQVLKIRVGEEGRSSGPPTFGGGGSVNDCSEFSGGGGGASDIRIGGDAIADRKVVGGGGGGGGGGWEANVFHGGRGGDAGGPGTPDGSNGTAGSTLLPWAGHPDVDPGGHGASQAGPGGESTHAPPGFTVTGWGNAGDTDEAGATSLGHGGNGGLNNPAVDEALCGGGGGGGYHGGGGGGSDNQGGHGAGGGGGGSSFADPSIATHAVYSLGIVPGLIPNLTPYVDLSWADTPPATTTTTTASTGSSTTVPATSTSPATTGTTSAPTTTGPSPAGNTSTPGHPLAIAG